MSKITCYLPVEIKTRELDSKLLLACELVASAGFQCVIGSKAAVNALLGSQAPFLYFDKGLMPENLEFCKKIHNAGGFLLSLDEEGGVIEKGMFTFLVRFPKEIMPFFDIIFLWGEELKKCLLERGENVVPERLFVTGHPRFDLRKKIFTPLYAARSEHLKSKYGPFVLINTSFAYANHVLGYERGIKAFPGYFGKGDPLKEGVDYAYYSLIIYYFVKAILELSKTFPKVNFILRPHPSENVEYYKKFFRNLSNVYVLQEGSVQEWILAAMAVIHHDCTTGIESFFAERPTFSYCPIRDNELAPELPMLVSQIVQNESELIEAIRRVINGKEKESNLEGDRSSKRVILEKWMANANVDAYSKIVEILKQKQGLFFEESPKRKKEIIEVKNHYQRAFFHKALKILWVKLSRFFSVSKKRNFEMNRKYGKQKMPGLALNELTEKKHALAGIIPRFKSISVKQLSDNAYLLS